jgi:antitoxin component YwqK of YwqJK toxin-antitoxin module
MIVSNLYNGKKIEYDYDGSILFEKEYKNDKLNGKFINYKPNG